MEDRGDNTKQDSETVPRFANLASSGGYQSSDPITDSTSIFTPVPSSSSFAIPSALRSSANFQDKQASSKLLQEFPTTKSNQQQAHHQPSKSMTSSLLQYHPSPSISTSFGEESEFSQTRLRYQSSSPLQISPSGGSAAGGWNCSSYDMDESHFDSSPAPFQGQQQSISDPSWFSSLPQFDRSTPSSNSSSFSVHQQQLSSMYSSSASANPSGTKQSEGEGSGKTLNIPLASFGGQLPSSQFEPSFPTDYRHPLAIHPHQRKQMGAHETGRLSQAPSSYDQLQQQHQPQYYPWSNHVTMQDPQASSLSSSSSTSSSVLSDSNMVRLPRQPLQQHLHASSIQGVPSESYRVMDNRNQGMTGSKSSNDVNFNGQAHPAILYHGPSFIRHNPHHRLDELPSHKHDYQASTLPSGHQDVSRHHQSLKLQQHSIDVDPYDISSTKQQQIRIQYHPAMRSATEPPPLMMNQPPPVMQFPDLQEGNIQQQQHQHYIQQQSLQGRSKSSPYPIASSGGNEAANPISGISAHSMTTDSSSTASKIFTQNASPSIQRNAKRKREELQTFNPSNTNPYAFNEQDEGGNALLMVDMQSHLHLIGQQHHSMQYQDDEEYSSSSGDLENQIQIPISSHPIRTPKERAISSYIAAFQSSKNAVLKHQRQQATKNVPTSSVQHSYFQKHSHQPSLNSDPSKIEVDEGIFTEKATQRSAEQPIQSGGGRKMMTKYFAECYVYTMDKLRNACTLPKQGRFMSIDEDAFEECQIKDFNFIPVPTIHIDPSHHVQTCDYLVAELICDISLKIKDPIFIGAIGVLQSQIDAKLEEQLAQQQQQQSQHGSSTNSISPISSHSSLHSTIILAQNAIKAKTAEVENGDDAELDQPPDEDEEEIPITQIQWSNLRVTKDMLKGRTKGFAFVVCFTYMSFNQAIDSVYSPPFWLFSNVNQEGFPKEDRAQALRSRSKSNQKKSSGSSSSRKTKRK